MRLLWTLNEKVAWPMVPFCRHMGWYGYHRPNGKRPDGFLEQKVDRIKNIMYDEAALKLAAPDFGDIEVMPKEFEKSFDKLYKVCHFE